jgi:hypothetical protein
MRAPERRSRPINGRGGLARPRHSVQEVVVETLSSGSFASDDHHGILDPS